MLLAISGSGGGGIAGITVGWGVVVTPSRKTQNICITFVQCWTNVFDVGPTLYKCYTNVFVFSVILSQSWMFSLTCPHSVDTAHQTPHFDPTLGECLASIECGGPTLCDRWVNTPTRYYSKFIPIMVLGLCHIRMC